MLIMQSNTGKCLVWTVQLMLRMLFVCTISQSISLSAQCTLSCPSGLNLSIAGPDFGCSSVLGPADIGVISPSCTGFLDLDLFTSTNQLLPGDTNPLGARVGIVTAMHIGQQLRARVTHRSSGNNCDIFLTIIDGLAPQLSTPDTIVSLLQELLPNGFGGTFEAISIEDCTSTTQFYTDSLVQLGCGASAYAKTYRTWTVTDDYGNSSTASQEISRVAVQLDSIQAPSDTTISCAEGVPVGVSMGFPVVVFRGESYELISLSGSQDNLFWSYSDETFSGGGGTAQLLRTFRFYDACAPAVAGQNPRNLVQRISVVDTVAPVISALVDTLFYSTSTTNCEASITLPSVTITDDCTNTPIVQVQLAGQFISSNGGYFGPLELGVYTAVYTASDSSNNSTTQPIVVVVRDQNPPVLITKSDLQVSLSTDGVAVVSPELFDQGSYDDCTEITWSIRLLSDTVWSNAIEINCDSINRNVDVEIRACDQYGNCNKKLAKVSPFDYLAPMISAPPNLTIDCSIVDTIVSIFGEVSISDNCSFVLSDSVVINRNQCGVGFIERYWFATDSSGNSSTASQVVSFIQSSSFSEDDIFWPRDTTLSVCDDSAPVALPIGVAEPSWAAVACSDIAVSYLDQTISGPSGVCEVVFRTWTVIDQCVYDGVTEGVWRHVQQLQLVDIDAPIVTANADTIEVYITTDSCGGGYFDGGIFAHQDCSEVISEIRFFEGLNLVQSLPHDDIAYFVSSKIDLAEFRSIDNCGNSDSIQVAVVFVDTIRPFAICRDTLQFFLDSDTSYFDPSLIDLNSYDECAGGLASLEVNFIPSCNVLGWSSVELVVTDSAGLRNTCFTEVEVIDTSEVCPLKSTIAYGRVATVNNHSIPTRFDLIGALGDTVSTFHSDLDGNFAFEVELLDSVTIVPSSNYAPPLFISTYDLYLIGRHILGINEFTDPLKRFAADANGSKSVSAFDMTLFRRLFLELSDKLPHGTSVRFIPTSSDLTLSDNALTPGILVNDVAESDSTSLAWHAIKLGDVSGTRSLGGTALTSRGDNRLPLAWNQVSETHWELSYRGEEGINLYGLGLWLSSTSVELTESLSQGVMRAESEEGTILSWLAEDFPLSLKQGFTLLRAESMTRPTLNLVRSDAVVSGFNQLEPLDYKLSVQYAELLGKEELSVGVYPNPAKAGTSLHVESTGKRISSLHLVDARGFVTELSAAEGLVAIGKLPHSLPPGIYALQGRYSDGQTFEQRILVSQ